MNYERGMGEEVLYVEEVVLSEMVEDGEVAGADVLALPFEGEAAVDDVPVVGGPGFEVGAVGGGADGDHAIVVAFGLVGDAVGGEEEGVDAGPGAGGGDGVIFHAGGVGSLVGEAEG